MRINIKALECLRIIINGDEEDNPCYRTGSDLVSFFKAVGIQSPYGLGGGSRGAFTAECLDKINGTPDLDKCIRNTFSPVNYIDKIVALDNLIVRFNRFLKFDKWAVVRDNDEITFKKIAKINLKSESQSLDIVSEDDFLKQDFEIDISRLSLQDNLAKVIQNRILEVNTCAQGAPLSAVIMIGSILEGLLLAISLKCAKEFTQVTCAPKDNTTGKVRPFPEWTLNQFIDAAYEVGVLKKDVKQFSHVVRDFRNYIHPYQQSLQRFDPDEHTALICTQVLRAAIFQMGQYFKHIEGVNS